MLIISSQMFRVLIDRLMLQWNAWGDNLCWNLNDKTYTNVAAMLISSHTRHYQPTHDTNIQLHTLCENTFHTSLLNIYSSFVKVGVARAWLRSCLENIRGLGVWADLLLSGWASQTGLTNDPMGSATAGGISDSLMRPQGFCAYSDRGRKRVVVWW